LITGFLPLARPGARVLILGSIPSEASLKSNQYFGNPRNSFWFAMSAITGVSADQPYTSRVEALLDEDIAVWDVMHSCKRQGSLDASIESASIVTNDFDSFFASHKHIAQVLFNGAKAETEYRRRVLPLLDVGDRLINYQRLPSTSPAMASLSPQQKQMLWREALC